MSARWGLLVGQDDHVGQWVASRTGGVWFAGAGIAVGFTFDGELGGGITYYHHNGANIFLGFAVEERRVFNRDSLRFAFHYPFEQLGCKRVTALVDCDNLRSLDFVKHLGFAYEATLADAAPNGDQFAFRMLKSECRWILNNRYQRAA